MKLATQTSIVIMFGLAIHGLTRNSFEMERLYNSRCECCGKPVIEPLKFTNAMPMPHTTNPGIQSEVNLPGNGQIKLQESALPDAIAEKEFSVPVPVEGVDPIVQDILNVRRQLGGSSIASILGSSLDTEDPEVEETMLFQQAVQGISGYAQQTNYEQAVEDAPSPLLSQKQVPPTPGIDRRIAEFVKVLCRFCF